MDREALGILLFLAARAGREKRRLGVGGLPVAKDVTCPLEAPRQITQSCGLAFTSGPLPAAAGFPSCLSSPVSTSDLVSVPVKNHFL